MASNSSSPDATAVESLEMDRRALLFLRENPRLFARFQGTLPAALRETSIPTPGVVTATKTKGGKAPASSTSAKITPRPDSPRVAPRSSAAPPAPRDLTSSSAVHPMPLLAAPRTSSRDPRTNRKSPPPTIRERSPLRDLLESPSGDSSPVPILDASMESDSGDMEVDGFQTVTYSKKRTRKEKTGPASSLSF